METNSSGSGEECPAAGGPSLLLLLPVLLSLLWVLVDLLYSSSLLGWAVTRLAGVFLRDSAIHLGAVQVSLLTGKVLFKDLHYYCRDFSIRVTDGYAVLRWWTRAGVGACSECALCGSSSPEKKAALVLCQLNGFELHWYKRSEVYDNWEQVISQEGSSAEESGEDSLLWSLWKELQPSLHFSFKKGRMVFGNHLVERSLIVYCSSAEAHYHTTEASNQYDELMHVVDMCGMEVRVVLEPSAGRCTEGQEKAHYLLKSDTAHVIYSWDSPGLVPLGDTSEPKFSWEIELGSNTVINYGCYANRQRNILQKFFFPNDYTERPASSTPQAGEKRIYTSMDVSVRLTSRGAFTIPFHDNKGILHQIGLSLGEGSEVMVHQPWTTNQNGYTTVVTGTLHNIVVTSDLSYPHLANAAAIHLDVDLHFPRVWNATQRWDMRLTGSEVEVGILFYYVDFVNALLDDWVGAEPPDLLHFVPVDWTIDISLSQYEIYMYTTRYNWLDKDNTENSRLAFCGTTGQIRLEFPFTAFLPLEQKVLFTANGQNLVVRHYVPPSSTSREAILALSSANKYRWRVMKTKSAATSSPPHAETSSSTAASTQPQASFTISSSQSEESLQQLLEQGLEDTQHFPMGYRRHTRSEDGWVDLACGPSISISILYLSRAHHPNEALPNSLRIDVDSPKVLLRVFGFLARDLLALKENYPGEYINFTTFHSSMPSEHHSPAASRLPLGEEPPPNPPENISNMPAERFLDVVVDFALHNITAEFPTYPGPGQPLDAALPSACSAELAVHVDYTASDTKVFLHISPFTVHIPSWHPTREGAGTAELGHIAFQGLNFNCHGLTEMMCGERVEYAWLMQLQLHRITGALSTLQLVEVANWLQATLQQALSVGDTLIDAPNGQPIRPKVEPISEDIKYRLFDLTIAEGDLHLLEGERIVRLQTPGLDLGTCMLHSDSETLGLSLQLHGLTCSLYSPSPDHHCLLQAGELDVGSVQGDITLREPLDCVPQRQRTFLRKADKRTRRLWFLWQEESGAELPVHMVGEFLCGCCGGCQFLDGYLQRRAPRHPSSCAVYAAEPPLPHRHLGAGTMARALGLQGLRRALHSACIRELECLQHIHLGLLNFCARRYPPVTEETPTAGQPPISSDTESFVSALASQEDSESDTNEYYSLENVNEAGLEGHVLPEQPRKKSRKKGSATSAEIADSNTSPPTLLDMLTEEDPLHTVVPTHCNQQLTFYVSTKKTSPPQPQRPEHKRQTSDSEYILHSQKAAHHLLGNAPLKLPQHSLATPTSTPGASLQHQPYHRESCLLLRLPLLLPVSPGSLPQVSFSASASAKKPKLVKQRQLDGPCSNLLVTLSLAGRLSITLTPPMEDLITSMASTLTQHFEQRSAFSILSANSLVTSLSLNSYLEKLMETPKDSKPFSVHITVGMAPDTFAALQAVQSSPRHCRLRRGGPGVREVVPHASLVTVFLKGLQVNSLIHSESEVVPDEMDEVIHLNSFKVSVVGQCAAVQVALAALLSQNTLSHFPTSSFPHLPPHCSRLDMSLAQHPGLFSLLEASCSNPSISAAAKIVAREVSHKAVLTWEHVHTNPLDSDLTQPSSQSVGRVKNKLVLSLSLPQLWADVAAPRTGRADPSTGGLDLLVAAGVVEVWQEKLKRMAETVQGLLRSKTTRDKMVMLALLSNAARSPLSHKVGHPLLSPISSTVRQCVSYHCLHQLWCTLPAYTDSLLSSIPPSGCYEEEVLAAAVALATRLFSHNNSTSQRKRLRSSPIPIAPTTCPSCGPQRPRLPTRVSDTDSESTVGYVSISPSPSELALPNVAFSSQNLDQADFLSFEELYHKVSFSSVVVVRESLLPLLQVVGVATQPQLRTLCHSKHHLLVDFLAHLKEGLVFVMEPTTSSSRTVPALCLKQMTVSGHLQSNTDNSIKDSPALCLLLGSVAEEGIHQSTTTAVTGNFSAEASSVDVGVTVPLMKLARHLVETARIRSSQRQRSSKPQKANVIPVFTAVAALEETDNVEQPLPPAMDIWRFARNLVGHLSTLERGAVQQRPVEQGAEGERAGSPVAVPSQAVSFSRPSSAGSVHSRSTRLQMSEYSRSPRFPRSLVTAPAAGEPQQQYLSTSLPTPSLTVPGSRLTRRPSNVSSTSEVAIQIEDVDAPMAMSPGSQEEQVSPLDTSGGDLASSDEMQLSSSSPKTTPSLQHSLTPEPSMASLPPSWLADTMPLQRTLDTPTTQLSHSFFGLLRVDFLKFQLQVETTTTTLQLDGITGSVDTRQLGTQPLPTSSPVREGESRPQRALPSYLSVMATVKKTFLGVSDRVLTESEVVRVEGQPIHCSFGLSNSHLLPVATYRCLLKVLGVKATVKQPPVRVHNRLQQLLPAFSQIFRDVFSPSPAEPATPTTPQPAATAQPSSEQPHMLTDLQLPSQLPQGYTHFSIARVELIMTPLPSLSIIYTVQPVVAQVETTQKIHYQLSIGSHTLRFNPREHQVSLRSLSLPTASLRGDVRASRSSKLPQVRVELAIKPVNIDLTTDILNQLLVLQNSFIKEVNELVQLFINIGESLPQQRQRLESMRREAMTESGVELLSFLDSCQLSLDGICITVSTPLCTAVRFSTGRIDMRIMNSGNELTVPGVVKSQLLLSGRVEINVNLALGYLQDSSEDDDFCELAYFRTKISIRNTQQSAPEPSLVGGAGEAEAGQPLDTFLISIICPHLYIQSSAVEQAILFWLNCKSVYSYWQNQRMQLNKEVREATEEFVAQIQTHRPAQLQTPSLDFSKPRLVQISVTDVGACMPMAPMPHTPHSSQKSFPALVLTIREMSLLVNLSRKVASSGNFVGFCIRFSNQFSLRHKTWTMDSRKNKITNCGIVDQGTFRLCVATHKRYSDTDTTVVIGEKLVWAFQWDMSGIDVNANTDIGHHMSTLVRTATTIGANLEGRKPAHKTRSGPATPPSKPPRKFHKRAMSETGVVEHEQRRDRMEEGMANLAKETEQVYRLKSSGASRDSLKHEFETLKETEQELRKKVGRMFRRRRGFSIQRLTEIFSPTSGGKAQRGILRRRWTFSKSPRRLFSAGDHEPSIPEEEEREVDSAQEMPTSVEPVLRPRAHTVGSASPKHVRSTSDVTDKQTYQNKLEDEMAHSSSPSLTPSVTPVPGEEPALPSPFPPTPISSQDTFQFEVPASSAQKDPLKAITSIDVEVNVTINVESGIVKLRCLEETSSKHRNSSQASHSPASHSPASHSKFSHFQASTSPMLHKRLHERAKDSSYDTVILLIPALHVQVHYKSIVGQSYNIPPSPSSIHLLPTPSTPFGVPGAPHVKVTPGTPLSPQPATALEPPVKRGIFSVSFVVASTPEDMTLTPSLLEFVEQVVRPTIAATVSAESRGSSDSDSTDESDSEEVEDRDTKTAEQTPAISFPVDVTISFHIQPSTVCLSCQPHSRVHCVVQSPDVSFVVSFSLFSPREVEGPLTSSAPVTFNNLYVTGCLKTFTLQLLSPQVSTLKQKDSDAPKIENKEALSLTLGQALTHLSRKSVLTQQSKMSPPGSLTIHSKLQVSVVTNIASLVLGYDMRRLNDITAFRRYWYRTSLVEAVFIGSKKPQHPSVPEEEGEAMGAESNTEPSPVVGVDNTISAAIVVAATVDDFRISANVAQVMGNTDLVVTHLRCQAHTDVSHNELVLLRLTGAMERGEVDARGGMVAGSVLMEDVQVQVTTESQHGIIPVHSAQMSLRLAEARVDYMSSCILLGRASQLTISLRDVWEGLQLAGKEEEVGEAKIQVLAELSWERVQLAIHRTTTKSMMNIVQKIQDFTLQQKRRSERTISIMLPADTKASKVLAAYREKEKKAEQKKDAENVDSRHHWLWATRVGSVELMRTLGVPAHVDHHKVSLGGKISLSGKNLCLVCFHGTSFRDNEWAVFNIELLAVQFSTRANPGLGRATTGQLPGQEGQSAQPFRRTCQQTCSLQLAKDSARTTELATVHRVTAGKGRVPPITGTNLYNWLAYACIDSYLHSECYEKPTTAQSTVLKFSKKLSIQQVLLVPALSVELMNHHFWPVVSSVGLGPQVDSPPQVECSLNSKFAAGISVSTNVDHYLFLHDLVTNYIEYLERHKAPLKSDSSESGEQPKGKEEKEEEPSGPPSRQFTCVHWELSPLLNLLSSVSGEFNPHISWLLERLGFKHARTTIPKWVQRGAMDPLDKVVSVAVELLVQLSAKKKLQLRASSPQQ